MPRYEVFWSRGSCAACSWCCKLLKYSIPVYLSVRSGKIFNGKIQICMSKIDARTATCGKSPILWRKIPRYIRQPAAIIQFSCITAVFRAGQGQSVGTPLSANFLTRQRANPPPSCRPGTPSGFLGRCRKKPLPFALRLRYEVSVPQPIPQPFRSPQWTSNSR